MKQLIKNIIAFPLMTIGTFSMMCAFVIMYGTQSTLEIFDDFIFILGDYKEKK